MPLIGSTRHCVLTLSKGSPLEEAARRFGYTRGSFRVLCHQFRQNPHREFFLAPAKGPRKAPGIDRARKEVIALRKQNLSIYDISRALKEAGNELSRAPISIILKEERFARLPRRRDEERPLAVRPEIAPFSDVRQLDLSSRKLRTRFGGLYLFLPYLTGIPFDQLLEKAGFPGSKMVPAGHAMRSLLALKLFGNARYSHAMSDVLDEGLALFAGLNRIPKRAFLTEYSCRINPACYPKFLQLWFDAVGALGLNPTTTVIFGNCASSCVKGMRHGFASRCLQPNAVSPLGRNSSKEEWPL